MKPEMAWRFAVHEAGHAVVQHDVGNPPGAVTIVPGSIADEGYNGFAFAGLSPDDVLRALDDAYDPDEDIDDAARFDRKVGFVTRLALISYAGKVAEELFFGGGDPATWEWDLRGAAFAVAKICDDDLDEERLFIEWISHRCASLVKRKRDVIERVARRLLEAKSLDADQVTAAINVAEAEARKEAHARRLRANDNATKENGR